MKDYKKEVIKTHTKIIKAVNTAIYLAFVAGVLAGLGIGIMLMSVVK